MESDSIASGDRIEAYPGRDKPTTRQKAVQDILVLADELGGARLADLGTDDRSARGLGLILWVPTVYAADRVRSAAWGKWPDKPERPLLVVKAVAARRIFVSYAVAHSVRRMPRAELRRRVARACAVHLDEEGFDPEAEMRVLEDALHENPLCDDWRVRISAGEGRRVQWFDAASGRRRQVNVGDVLVVVSPSKPDVLPAPRRAPRPKAEYPYRAAGIEFMPME